MKWKFIVRPLPIAFGVLAGLGVAVLLQQYAVTTLTPLSLVLLGLAGAVFYGIGPTIVLNLILMRDEGGGAGVQGGAS